MCFFFLFFSFSLAEMSFGLSLSPLPLRVLEGRLSCISTRCPPSSSLCQLRFERVLSVSSGFLARHCGPRRLPKWHSWHCSPARTLPASVRQPR
ncbi:uncharacterized protein LY79DRAFT_536175 [Colletotrichum navitas]|uniref:Secreted protein n=1 Tax=Colletotrichum navitas TaxID=681940 RepID=A0AAD8QE93_9PEZI|nr:uncharacterized protein LY79DRAFT_536175 [Colletotrichum navitas]KAK1599817.1 hypothetical protein LY79DRAFT_536175 [Colletotrichum navitas]